MTSTDSRNVERLQPPIADYGFLSDCRSAALVDRDGSIDWWCVPRFDSPSVFGRLLDADAGHWTIRPVGDFESERSYVGDSLVLRTVFRTSTGDAALTDAAALEPGSRGHDIGHDSPHVLLRRIEGLTGTTRFEIVFAPRMEYGRTTPHVWASEGRIIARGGPTQLTLTGPGAFDIADGSARALITIRAGDIADFSVAFAPTYAPQREAARSGEATLEDTRAGWQSWSDLHDGYTGRYASQVKLSSVVLQGLTYQPSGAIIAAATTSLPETMGGDLNWDYRFAWLRDLSLTIRSLWIAACPAEPARLLDWFVNAAGKVGDELFQIMYGVEGERDLSEHTLDHLRGYRDSRPVRIGNEAWSQVQLDVLGEVLDAVNILKDEIGEFDSRLCELIVVIADRAAAQWAQPDAGMWEARDEQRHYVSSKVMCWVALDRAIALADRVSGAAAHVDDWLAARTEVRAAILDQAWSDRTGAYAGAFGSDELDASVLIMPLVGFLTADDPRMRATIDLIERELGDRGVVRRWREDESGFLICTFWLAECFAIAGDVERAERWFVTAAGFGNDLGLMSEETTLLSGGELLGNFPQAFSHVGLINAAWRLDRLASETTAR